MVLDPINGSRPYVVRFWLWANSWHHGTPASPAKLGPGGPFGSWGPPIAPMDHGPRHTGHGVWSMAHGPRTVGPQKTEMAKNGHTSSNHQKHPRTPKRPQRPWNQILFRFIIEEGRSQDHHRGLFEATSKDTGDKTS
ncbi:hypothetical protein O181_119317 [Austropuccinia psidii MF-1]|uniref:Uncharacterized protein n=1 Tax=Austropuccinia psidii MF-1 TaxID=1389203 RepID=A0A9Q3KH08_9BASI|nr:hypothetical protein [Austropuccinia psidii MF-1]